MRGERGRSANHKNYDQRAEAGNAHWLTIKQSKPGMWESHAPVGGQCNACGLSPM